jgi:hypothetical protein
MRRWRPSNVCRPTVGLPDYGLDIDRQGIKMENTLAIERGLSNRCQFHLHNATNPFDTLDSSFDLIFAIDSIFHIPQRVTINLNRPGYRVTVALNPPPPYPGTGGDRRRFIPESTIRGRARWSRTPASENESVVCSRKAEAANYCRRCLRRYAPRTHG